LILPLHKLIKKSAKVMSLALFFMGFAKPMFIPFIF
jgi:hypothetical protein